MEKEIFRDSSGGLTPEEIDRKYKAYLAAKENLEAVEEEYRQAAPQEKVEFQKKLDNAREICKKIEAEFAADRDKKTFPHLTIQEDMQD
ncbi:MAG: hypothetical protein A3J65_04015 [Candidatus Buchananbacteria bacterium RIFCSPHIGHO2_02_FULL_45_11b]|uniref:Uncharacterized protein n=4 Tax=Candidatus Buchananiibacteriota TaxID=1817903 RepID=A0A1G1YM08_9BACT|nr:MAG: hypothetical protein A2663_02490 [Candidatus Buchananbacteria bacterium RIFCSPHIGHO2_01_FULL_46_12]OGY51354.1 MAG: hypothetical protein A3J65_04015 [Candidatus Buchananbacteria bacterium RIFCSPHIGHO2_02_FULL_45_11b]OGY53388.1 MAG: hypothetical protein A3B15_02435 [Candidatus Buchananbacteria bacterium RIFCSPLOWO2_01_FULL_45_31]OGY57397.1 MAG: hypothetical protein A3H67_04665 [Candidatus Buchananbacteria bacterium RIFCSPLOWO2_02_FULL_46_11b]